MGGKNMLPMMGFFFLLMAVGAICSLATVIDKIAAKKAPIPFAMFFSGLSFNVLFFLALFLSSYGGPWFGNIMALLALLVGGIGGAIFGYGLGLKRRASVTN